MNCHSTIFRWSGALLALCAALLSLKASAQNESTTCSCPPVSMRDTVWVSDHDGAGVGSEVWTCDHLYVLTEQVFVNSPDTLVIEPGTVVLGQAGTGRSEWDIDVSVGVGVWRQVSYETYPGALIVARGAYLDAQGTVQCPIQFSFLGDPMDGSVGLDVQGQWGGLVLCGGGHLNTMSLEMTFGTAPSLTTGVGTGEDRAEGIVDVSGQERTVYGGKVDSTGSSGVLKYISLRHGSTNLGWTQYGNGNETDLLQLAGCGAGTIVSHIECVGSADDGLHILGGSPQVSHVLSAFHREDAFESDQGWCGSAQFLLGIQDTALSVATNPPGPSFVYDAEGDDFQDGFNVDFDFQPFSLPVVHNMTLITNGALWSSTFHSLSGGDWVNNVVHGVTDAGAEVQGFVTCDGFNAMDPYQYSILTIRNWRVQGVEGVIPGRYNGIYGQQGTLSSWLADSACVVETVLVDGEFALENGVLVDGLNPRAMMEGTVSPYYVASDPRLEPVTYHGALAPDEDPWFMGWSLLGDLGLYNGPLTESVVAGCTYAWACNYDATADVDDGSCEVTSCAGCTYSESDSYDPNALFDDGSCMWSLPSYCLGDLNQDWAVSTQDLLLFLTAYGEPCDE